ncbi:MAG: YihY/virulence factor BrkB family protein [Acidobacteriota bacterium]|nr:YihY/virulence factor BrkB family protein [Acidobacteriota bacterium]MDE3094192.1 YihY/virulence factor BrkB family protein [Acidobacteriota bacterium]
MRERSLARTRETDRRAREVARLVLVAMRRDRVNVAAGAFAYRWFLSLFPLIIALLGVASLVTLPHHVVVSLIHGVTIALPSGAAAVITSSLDHAQRHATGGLATTIVASVVALWSSTSGMVVVEEGLDMAFGLANDRGFVERRLVALPLLLGSVVLGGAASALTVFGASLGRVFHRVVALPGAWSSITWDALRWVVALALVNLLLSMIYFVAPNRRARWRWTSAGTLVATATWALVSLGFSLYTSEFTSFGSTYGAFAGVAILIFWLYLSGLAILLGAEVDAVLGGFHSNGSSDLATSQGDDATGQ